MKTILILNSPVTPQDKKIKGELDTEYRFCNVRSLRAAHRHAGCEYFDVMWFETDSLPKAERDNIVATMKHYIRRPQS